MEFCFTFGSFCLTAETSKCKCVPNVTVHYVWQLLRDLSRMWLCALTIDICIYTLTIYPWHLLWINEKTTDHRTRHDEQRSDSQCQANVTCWTGQQVTWIQHDSIKEHAHIDLHRKRKSGFNLNCKNWRDKYNFWIHSRHPVIGPLGNEVYLNVDQREIRGPALRPTSMIFPIIKSSLKLSVNSTTHSVDRKVNCITSSNLVYMLLVIAVCQWKRPRYMPSVNKYLNHRLFTYLFVYNCTRIRPI